MLDSLANYFESTGFMPHGHCFLWTPSLLWTFVVSDVVIATSYFSIPFALWYFAHKRPDVPFRWIFVIFGGFVLACGTTHLVEVWNIWHADYWADAFIKALTAGMSAATAILLWPLIPQALKVPSQTQLENANRELQNEVMLRRQAESALLVTNEALEHRIAERTAQLEITNKTLRESEARFRSLVEMSSDFYWESDAEHRLTRRSVSKRESAEQLYLQESITGKCRWEIPYLAPDEAGWQAHHAILDAHLPFRNFEISRPRANGALHHISISGDPVFNASGKFEGYRGVGTDTTERKQNEAARDHQRVRFETILRTASDGIHVLDIDGVLIDANDAFLKMLGYGRQAIGSLRVSDWDEQEKWSHIRKIIDDLIVSKESILYETRHRRSDGKVIDVEISGCAIEIEGEKFIYASSRDITERRRAETELRILSRAVEQSPASIVITDREGRIEYVNPKFEKVSGYTLGEARGQNPRLLQSGLTQPGTYKDLWNRILTGGEWRGEMCNKAKNGELFWEYATISGLKGENGEVEHYIAVKEDITERKRASDALRESDDRFSAVFHASPIAIGVSRAVDGKVLDINESGLRLYGYRRDQMIGRTVNELGLYTDPEHRTDLLARLRHQSYIAQFERDFRKSDGTIGKMELTGRLIEVRGEQCILAMMVDVTERKRLEELHLQAQKLESLGTLSAGIAHDFNNVLAAIHGNVDLAAQDIEPGHVAAASLEEIKKAAGRASELVRRIMAFGRTGEAIRQVVDCGAVVEEVLKLLRSTLPAQISLTRDFAKDTPRVLADSGQIHEAVVNLTTNAAYAIGPRAGSIEYRLEPVQVGDVLAQRIPGLNPGLYARLTVSDTGFGIDAAIVTRIFDAFYTTKPVGEGTGLGLSMVHGIMRGVGGAVTVESTANTGSRFALYFPAAGDGMSSEAGDSPAPRRISRGQRVLFVDDEEALVYLAERVLARLGHNVTGFTDPVKALATLRAGPHEFDFVVTDLSMPRMSGFEFAREVLAIRPEIPVLMTSGYIRADDERLARKAGIRELILKPTTMDELASALDHVLTLPVD